MHYRLKKPLLLGCCFFFLLVSIFFWDVGAFDLFFSHCTSPIPAIPCTHIAIARWPHEVPAVSQNPLEDSFGLLLFEGLLRRDPEGNLLLGMAESIECSPDGLRYFFTLREACWSDGKPVVAHDFVVAWEDAFLKNDDPYAPILLIKRMGSAARLAICAMSDSYLCIELEHPSPYFLSALAAPPFLPLPSHLSSMGRKLSADLVGNGPFCLAAIEEKRSLLFAKNEHYWDHMAVQLEWLCFDMVQDDFLGLQWYAEEKINWLGGPFSDISLPLWRELYWFTELKPTGHSLLGHNCLRLNGAKAPLKSKAVRKMLCDALAPDLLCSIALSNSQNRAYGLISEERLPSAAEAGELALLMSDLPTEPMSILYERGNPVDRLLAYGIGEQWRPLPMQFCLQPEKKKALAMKKKSGNFLIALDNCCSCQEDPIALLLPFLEESASFSSPELWISFCAAIESAKRGISIEQRVPFLRAAEAILLEECFVVPLFHPQTHALITPNLANLVWYPHGCVDFKWAYCQAGELANNSK